MRYFLKKTKIKKGVYLQIYESHYVPSIKGNRNKCYKTIGYVAELISDKIPDPISYYQKEVDALNASLIEDSSEQIGEFSTSKNVGYFLLKAMIDKLNFDKDLKIFTSSCKFQFDFINFFKQMIYAQVVEPTSKLKAFEKVIPSLYDAMSISYDQMLNGVNFIGVNYERFIELLNIHINKIWPRKLNNAYFDCTNYYFEIDEEDSIRKKGPSKEQRHDPILGQALLLDENYIPLAMTLYAGNESEKPFLRNTIEDITNRYDINSKTKIVQVADKGLNCARNIYAAVKEANDGYIFSKSVHGKNLSIAEKKWVLLNNDKNVWFEVKDDDNNVIYKYKSCIDTFEYHCKINDSDDKEVYFKVKEKRIVTFNPSLARKKIREINKEVEKAKTLSLNKALKEEYGDAAKYCEFVAVNNNGEKVKLFSALKENKIKEDLALAGYNLLVTSEVDKTEQDIYNAYHNLWRIEESFRILKSYLLARPAFLQKPESIYGHFLICYYALTILRLLEFKIFNDSISTSQIIEFIRNYKVTEGYAGSYINNASRTRTFDKIKKVLNLSKLGNLYLIKRDIDNLFRIDF